MPQLDNNEEKALMIKQEKRREMSLRFGKSMIKKTFQPMKKVSAMERRKKLGIDCEEEEMNLNSGKNVRPLSEEKKKKRSVVDMSLFESSDDDIDDEVEEEKVNNRMRKNKPSDFIEEQDSSSKEEEEIIQKKKKRKVSSTTKNIITSERNVKIPKTAKYYTSLGVETCESSNLDLEFIEISSNSNSKKKILEIKELVDSSLNYDESEEDFTKKPYKLFICLEKDSRVVVGCLIAEKISSARRIHFKRKENESSSSNNSNSSDNGCDDILSALFESFKHSLSQSIGTEELHSPKIIDHPSLDMADINFDNSTNEKEKAVCGISRIWVSDDYRRRGIGTKLLDYTRKHLCYAYQVPRQYIALTPFTPLGFKFIIEYLSKGKTRVDSVLVY